ncbi:hypothetical protein ACVIKO_000046 [Rhizobium ruizarguesonis]
MRVVAIKNPKSQAEKRLVHEMHRLRARVFRGRLAWNVRCTSGLEIDRFDKLSPTYILCINRSDAVMGCTRLLPAIDGTMLEQVLSPAPGDGTSPHSSSNDRKFAILRGYEQRCRTGARWAPLGDTRDVCRHRRVEHSQRLQGNRDRDRRQARAHPPSCGLASEPTRLACTDQRNEKRRRPAPRRLAELRSPSPQHLLIEFCTPAEGSGLIMLITQNRSLPRLVSKLQNALGDHLCVALEDPSVVEIMLNPDGRLFIERLGHGMAAAGEMTRSAAETVIGSVAHVLNSEVDDDRPIVSGELPIGGHRFEGLLPPVVSGPSFTIRRRASRLIPLDDYVSGKVMTAKHAEIVRSAIASKLNILVAGGTGSGKTTLTNAILAEIVSSSPDDRLVILEDTAEIQCSAENAVCLHTSDAVDMARACRKLPQRPRLSPEGCYFHVLLTFVSPKRRATKSF